MKASMTSGLVLAALLLGAARADIFIETQTFGSSSFHENYSLGTTTTAGLVVGWILFGIAVILGGVMIIHESITRHKLYVSQVEEARKKMQGLGIDVKKADEEFERRLKGVKQVDEDADLLAAAEHVDDNKA